MDTAEEYSSGGSTPSRISSGSISVAWNSGRKLAAKPIATSTSGDSIRRRGPSTVAAAIRSKARTPTVRISVMRRSLVQPRQHDAACGAVALERGPGSKVMSEIHQGSDREIGRPADHFNAFSGDRCGFGKQRKLARPMSGSRKTTQVFLRALEHRLFCRVCIVPPCWIIQLYSPGLRIGRFLCRLIFCRPQRCRPAALGRISVREYFCGVTVYPNWNFVHLRGK